MTEKVEVSDQEELLLRCLADHYLEHGNPDSLDAVSLNVQALKAQFQLEVPVLRRMLARFQSYGMLELKVVSRNLEHQFVEIDESLLAFVHSFDNPVQQPRPDRIKEITDWAKSSWGISILVVGIGLGVPWVVGIIAGAKTILLWFGVKS